MTFVWTHDSIGLGEDGPTHQPVEHLWALRAIPGLDVVRPADANETTVAWRTILEHTDRPAGLCLSRQKLPVFDRSELAGCRAAPPGRVRAGRGARRRAGRDPDRHRQRGADRAGRQRGAVAGRRSRPGWCRCRASSGSTSRTRPTATRCCRRGAGQGQRGGRDRTRLARHRRRRWRDRSAWSTSARRRPTRSCTPNSASPPRRRGGSQAQPRQGRPPQEGTAMTATA